MTSGNDTLRFAVQLERSGFSLNVNAELPLDGITGVFGASGAGKTSLLRCLAGLEPQSRGEIVISDQPWLSSTTTIPAHRRRIGYVFQDARLFPHLKVRGNLDYAWKRAEVADGAYAQRDKIIELLHLGSLLDRTVEGLSGGEQQRVAIARAALSAPSLLLLDEPVAALDRARKDDVLPLIRALHESLRIPVLFVSHQLDEICQLCDQLLVMADGCAVACGPIEDVLLQTELPLLGGREAGSVIRGVPADFDEAYGLTTVDISGGKLRVPGRYDGSATLRLRLRANDISLCRERPQKTSILNVLAVRIEAIDEESAHSALVRLKAGEDRLLARLTRRSVTDLALVSGNDVYAQIKSVSVRHQRAS